MHQQILNGSLPNRQLVVVNLKSGFTDNLMGKVTALYLSLLTKRALRFVNFGNLTQSTVALESRFLDLYAEQSSFPPEILSHFAEKVNGTKLPYAYPRQFAWHFETNKTYSPLYIVNCEIGRCLKHFFLTGNISEYKPDVEHLMLALNRGASFQLMENLSPNNSANRKALHDFGLKSGQTAYQCAFFFLFKPTMEVERRYINTWTRLADPAPLKIGIHIRAGDSEFAYEHSLQRGRLMLQAYQNYFLCAQEIENTRRKMNQTVLWYLISDSLSLRLAAHEHYGDKLIVEKIKAMHLDCAMTNMTCSNSGQNMSMIMAAGEMLAFSLADYHVTGKNSGFARSGTWLSIQPLPRTHIFTIEGKQNRSCAIGKHSKAEEESRRWSGVRLL